MCVSSSEQTVITFTQRLSLSRWGMMLKKLRAATGASGTNLVQESGPVAVSIEQVLMGKKRKHLLVLRGAQSPVSHAHDVTSDGNNELKKRDGSIKTKRSFPRSQH